MKNKAIALLLASLAASNGYCAIALNTGSDQDRISSVVTGCPTSTNKATYTMWVYDGLGSKPNYMAVFESRSVGLQGVLFNDAATPVLNCAWTGTEYGLSSGLTLPLSEWALIVCQIDGTARRSSVWGRHGLIKSYSYTGTDTTQNLNGTYVWGQDTAVPGGREFAGWMGETRIYGRKLTDQEVEALARGLTSKVSTEGLCGHWRFDERTSGDASGADSIRDFSGKGNEATPISGSTPPVWVHSQPINYE